MFQILNPLALHLHSERKQVELQLPPRRKRVVRPAGDAATHQSGGPCGVEIRLHPATPGH
jgi:hypothetical protein